MRKLALGFTLIELLVVISIIGILATLVSANLNSARSRARDAQRKSDLKNLSTALRLYYNDEAAYPVDGGFVFSGSFENAATGTVYIEEVPNDPLYDPSDATSPQYHYDQTNDGDGFTLSACLENKSDAGGGSVTVPGWTCSTAWVFQLKQ
jgi:general secretion pathway protein G